MANPQITYRGMPHSPTMDARILELAAKLDDLHPKITRCHVVVDAHNEAGRRFWVHLGFRERTELVLCSRDLT